MDETQIADRPALEVVRPEPQESDRAYFLRRATAIRAAVLLHGYTPQEVADAYGLTLNQVRRVALGKGDRVHRRPVPEEWTRTRMTRAEALAEEPLLLPSERITVPHEAQLRRAAQLHRWRQAGLSLSEIAQRHGISKQRVSELLRKYGFPTEYRPPWLESPVGQEDHDHDEHAGNGVAANPDRRGAPAGAGAAHHG